MLTRYGRNPKLYQPKAPKGFKFCVYRIYDKRKRLLYVGATLRVSLRLTDHSANKSWWSEVDHSKIRTEWFPCIYQASDEEERAIATERPKYNVHGLHMKTNGYRNSRAREGGCVEGCCHFPQRLRPEDRAYWVAKRDATN